MYRKGWSILIDHLTGWLHYCCIEVGQQFRFHSHIHIYFVFFALCFAFRLRLMPRSCMPFLRRNASWRKTLCTPTWITCQYLLDRVFDVFESFEVRLMVWQLQQQPGSAWSLYTFSLWSFVVFVDASNKKIHAPFFFCLLPRKRHDSWFMNS